MSTINMTDMEEDIGTFYARQQLWWQYAGPYTLRKCLYPWCTRMMSQDTFCVVFYDHSGPRDVTSFHNMRPVCDVCYASMRQPTMREWVDHMDYTHSVEALHTPSHGEEMNSPSSNPSVYDSQEQDQMES